MSNLQLKMDKPLKVVASEVEARPKSDEVHVNLEAHALPERLAPVADAGPAEPAAAAPAGPEPKKKNRCAECKKKVRVDRLAIPAFAPIVGIQQRFF